MSSTHPEHQRPTPLDPLTLPFGGSRLIEASAGTGKTFTIAGLYVRLLLGHDIPNPLRCEQILVVTFTNAATGELRDRIRKKIQLAYRRFIGLDTDDKLIESLYQLTPESDRPLALKRLDLALKSLDEASIFTIHGFCQRILADMAFESSLLFESEFTLDDSEFLHHAVRDFWREHCYALPINLAEIIQNKFASPDALSKQLRPLLGASQASAQPTPQPFDKLQQTLNQSLSRLKLIWPRERSEIETLLHTLPLSGVRFGKKSDAYPKLTVMLDAMDNWCQFSTSLPPMKVMECLSLSELKLNKGGEVPSPQQAPVLDHIERVCTLIKDFIPSFLYCAKKGISSRFTQQKSERNLLTPDDLLITLENALHPDDNNLSSLANTIATRFPVALIDEFQDTDPLQFSIFNRIYQMQPSYAESFNNQPLPSKNLSLLMIGDPKQAIYAFRGADIHTYIQARAQTKDQYHLETNYRSSRAMIMAVNALFGHRDDAFISSAIVFESVKPSPLADKKVFVERESEPAALKIKLLSEDPDKGLNKTTARKRLAEDAAAEICSLLTQAQAGECTINAQPLKAKDIAVLVRDRNEAAVIKQSLSDRQIGAVFLSRDSVFNTLEAREMALVLHALATPKDERALRSALATSLLGYDAVSVHRFNQDEIVRQTLLEQFDSLHQNWLKRGIMPALLNLANDTTLITRLLQGEDGERRLTDFRHLAELLQQKATELDGINALVNWYEQALIDNNANEEAQLRLESEQNLVQIVTIHKSKGLEYPVCFIPFVSLARDNRRKPAPMLYHENNKLVWDIAQTDEGWERHKRENLAEDLRLLYVAMTRPVYQCYLYVANHSRFTKKAGITSQLHETGIGYLLGIEDKSCEFSRIQSQAQHLITGQDTNAVSVIEVMATASTQILKKQTDFQVTLTPKSLKRKRYTPWRVGSYSGLVKDLPHEHIAPGADDEAFPELDIIQDEIDPTPSRFTFERGANAGSFMHLVLELIDFTQAETELPIQLPIAMEKYGILESWYDVLMSWYLDLLASPLIDDGSLTLAQLTPSQKLVEMEFYLPIRTLQADKLNQLLAHYGYSADLNFESLKGMLKGFIDLIFEHQGQFYIADYKSNHLGDEISHYGLTAMQEAIGNHRYDLQYILYTLVLHRYLRLKMPDYDYDQHIGGSYYLFLRGMSVKAPQSGVFYDKPSKALIESLDALFDCEQNITRPLSSPTASNVQREPKL